MTEDKKPEALEDQELDQANGGITLDNGIKFKAKVETTEGPLHWTEISTMHQSIRSPAKG